MKKLTLLSLFSCYAFSFGGVVTDPGSYTYYGTQIEKAVKQIETMEKQYKQAVDTYKEVTSIDDNITGNLQRAINQLKKLKSMQEINLANGKDSLLFTKKTLNEITDIPEFGEDVISSIEDTFGAEQQKRNDWISVEAEKRATKQKALKNAIVDAETAQGKIDYQLKQIEDLASMTNGSNNIKDSTDINNSILLQMAEQQQEMIKLLANISKNLALASYDGKENSPKPNIVEGKDLLNPDDWKTDSKKAQKRSTSDILSDCNPFEQKCR